MSVQDDLIPLAKGIWVESWLVSSLTLPTALPASADLLTLDEHHPMWDHASGGDRNHPDRQWKMTDITKAAITLDGIAKNKAGVFFSILLEQPGRLFSTAEIIERAPATFKSAYAVAGCLNGFTRHCERTGKVYPFYWWEADEALGTRYAIRPSTAAVFRSAQ